MTIKCVAIDDEPLALQLLRKYVQQVPFLELVDTFVNPLEALSVLQETKVDLLFLDIRMPDLNGFQFLNSLKEKPLVILTTAYNQYGPESYEFEVADYLIKPIPFEKFLKAVNKAKELKEQESSKIADLSFKAMDDYIFVNSEYKLIRIKVKDIIYIEGLKDYIKIYIEGSERPILTIMRIKTFEENLSDDFVRVHRSFLININRIDYIKKNRIYIGKHEVPIGEIYSESFFKIIEDKNWK